MEYTNRKSVNDISPSKAWEHVGLESRKQVKASKWFRTNNHGILEGSFSVKSKDGPGR